MLYLNDLRVCGTIEPIAVDPRHLRASWRLTSDLTGVSQTAYEARVYHGGTQVASTGRVKSAEQTDIVLPVEGLLGGEGYTLRVEVTDNYRQSACGETLFYTVPDDMPDVFVKSSAYRAGESVWFARAFSVAREPVRAVLYAVALGCGDLYLDGEAVSDGYFDMPSYAFEKAVCYRAYDLTCLLQPGPHTLTCHVGDGAWADYRRTRGTVYAERSAVKPLREPCFWAVLEMTDAAGKKTRVTTADGDWYCQAGPVLVNRLRGGEIYDARREVTEFPTVDEIPEGWLPAVPDGTEKGPLRVSRTPPSRVQEILPVARVECPSGSREDGLYLLDFGRMLTGCIRLRLPAGVPGAPVTVRYSRRVLGDEDVLDFSAAVHPGGYSRQDIYITGGAPEGELWESGFACRTFRYAEISGLPALREIDAGMVRGLSVTYDTPPRSEFSCGDETLMRLYRRAVDVFGLRRPGEVEIRTKAEKHDLLYDRLLTSDFLLLRCDADDYLSACVEALTDEASDKEATFSPDPLGRHDTTTVMLRGIALARMAWLLWQQRGLTRPVETAYPALRRWLFSVELRFPDLLPTKGPEDRGLLREDDVAAPQMMMTALAFFETICRIADMAAALGLRTDAESCRTLASHVRRTYLLTFSEGEDGLFGYPAVDAAARCAGMTEQTETLMEILRRAATQTPDRRGWGVRGLRAILRALSEGGEIDAALTLLRDPALLAYAESDVAKAEDMSFAADLVELAAGVRPLEPGYSRFAFSPRAWKAVGGYHLVLDTPHGKIKVDVTPAGELTLVVPPCTLCRYGQSELRPGTYHLRLT